MIRFGIITLIAVLGLDVSIARAAPVTFRFKAEIQEITPSLDATFPLPDALSVGGILEGLVTFEPPFAFGRDSEGASLRVSIDSFVLSGEDLVFDTVNDTGGTTGNSTFLNDYVNVLTDSLDVIVQGVQITQFGLLLAGEGSTVNPLFDRIEDVSIWNSFQDRNLILEVVSLTSPGEYRIVAALGPAVVVPEPASIVGALVILAITSIRRSRRRSLSKK